MTDAASLTLVLEHAETARERARGELQRAEAQCQAARQQLAQLQDYREQTERRTAEQFRQSASIALLQCHQGFVARLGQAIEQQQQALQAAEQRLEAARQRWTQAERQVAAVGKLIERRTADAQARADRRDQRQTDEQAMRAARPTGASTLSFAADRA